MTQGDPANADIRFMRMALEQAKQAGAAGEVPVGAVVVKDGLVLGVGRNAPIGTHDPSAHAEIVALRVAAAALGNYRLEGCDLFVTLEPCAMCVGAMLHARIRRVVFGAMDPKTGAAGSVINLFNNRDLNHHTHAEGGVLASACASLLHDFFVEKRAERARLASPLRDDALRTPDRCFDGLPDYPWAPHYFNDLPTLGGLRMHYLDEGSSSSLRTILCLHGYPAWSFLFRKMLPGLLAAGYRVVAPDLVGFGKSDKPKKPTFHTWTFHQDSLQALVQSLDLRDVVVVGQGEGIDMAVLLMHALPERIASVVALGTPMKCRTFAIPPSQPSHAGAIVTEQVPHLSAADRLAYQAPFVDAGYCAALKGLYFGSKAVWPAVPELGTMHIPFVLTVNTAADVGDFLPEAGAEVVQKLLAHIQA